MHREGSARPLPVVFIPSFRYTNRLVVVVVPNCHQTRNVFSRRFVPHVQSLFSNLPPPLLLLPGFFIVGCKRTAFGASGGKLKDVGSVEMGVIAARAAIEAAKIKPELI